MRTSKNQLIIDYLSETAAENDLKGILIGIFNKLEDNSNIDSVINEQLSDTTYDQDELNTMLTKFENQLDKDYKEYTDKKVDMTNKANVSSKGKLVLNKDGVDVASINRTSNNTSTSNIPTTSNNTSTPIITEKPTAVIVRKTNKNISNTTTIANPLEQENKIAHDYPIQKVNITWYPAKCWADAVIRMLYSAPSSRKFFIEYKSNNETFKKISEIFNLMHNKDNKNNTDRYTYSETNQPYITYNKLEKTLGNNFDAEKDAPSYEFCRSNESTKQYNQDNILKYTSFYDPAEFYNYIMDLASSSELSTYFSFTHSIDAKCKDNQTRFKTVLENSRNIINLDNLGNESSIQKKINESSIQKKIKEFLDIKSTSFPENYAKIVNIIQDYENNNNNSYNLRFIDNNKINDETTNKNIFNFYRLKGVQINNENNYKNDIFYKYHEYFMNNKNENWEKTTDFFKDVYEFGAMSRHSKCDGITNHIEYEQDTLEFTDQNKYIVIFVQRRDSANTNLILQNTIIPDKKISISHTPYTLTGIISLSGPDHYIYYECNDNGDVIRVYDDKKPYIDVTKNNKLTFEFHINTNGCMFLYSRYPVDQYMKNDKNYIYNKQFATLVPIDKINEKLLDNASTKQYTSGRYYGQIKDDKRDGYGEMIYNDGKKYEGQWKNDRINGQGKIFKNYNKKSATFIQTGDDGKIYNNIVTPMEETTYILPTN